MSIDGQTEAQVSPAGDEWRERALCAEVDPELWFPESGEPNLAAKLICGRCEVRAQCLAFALESNEQYGVWGGLSLRERRWLRRRFRDGLPAVVEPEGEVA